MTAPTRGEGAPGGEAAVAEELRRKWARTQGISTAFYVNFAIIAAMLMLLAGIPLADIAPFAAIIIVASIAYRLIGPAHQFLGRRPADWVIALAEAAPLTAWAWASMIPDLEPKQLAAVSANWGAALLATAVVASTRFSAVIAARLASFALFAWFLAGQPINEWAVSLAAAALLTALAIGVGYLSYLRTLEETRLSLALEAAEAEAHAASVAATAEYERRQAILRSIGHDLRQPMSAIRMLTRPLSQRLGEEDELAVAMRASVSAAHDMLDSIENMAWLTDRRELPDFAAVPLWPLMTGLAREVGAAARAAGGGLRLAPCSLTLWSDEVMLRRVLRNLLDNAVKHAGGGRILLGARRRRAGAERWLEIWVVDEGPGLAMDDQTRLFREFTRGARTSVDGLGIGLAVVKDLTLALGCRPVLRSTPGKGSIFGLRAPGELIVDLPPEDLGADQGSIIRPLRRAE